MKKLLNSLLICCIALISSCTEGMLDETKQENNGENSGGVGIESTHGPITIKLESVSATTAIFSGSLDMTTAMLYTELGFIYSTDPNISKDQGKRVKITSIINNNKFMELISELPYDTEIYYAPYYCTASGLVVVGEVQTLKTGTINVESSVDNITETTINISGKVNGLSIADIKSITFGLYYHKSGYDSGTEIVIKEIEDDGTFAVTVYNLTHGTDYRYFCFIEQNGKKLIQGDIKDFTTINAYSSSIEDIDMTSATDLSSLKSANCYIISKTGTYKFKTTKGNSNISVGDVKSCTIVWESYAPNAYIGIKCNTLISSVCYKNGYIAFKTPSSFTDGNALIAAKDASGNILWSWHIWMTATPPKGQVYYNNAGTMMDTNLGGGSTSRFGLLYQWGRKDPFLGAYSEATITWPRGRVSDAECGTIEWATAHPTDFIMHNDTNKDWYYTGSSRNENERWKSVKTIYDPCPAGWRVPIGGENSIWYKACGNLESTYVDFSNVTKIAFCSGILGGDDIMYYLPGYINADYELCTEVVAVNEIGRYWTTTPYDKKPEYGHNVYVLGIYPSSTIKYSAIFNTTGTVSSRADAHPIRCQKE